MTLIAETNRLYLREFNASDAIHFFEMNKDPEVIQFTGDSSFSSLLEAQKFIEAYDQYKKYNMGRWAVIRKGDNAFLGWCGLKFHPKEHLIEVGYRFYKKYWGHGYATESCKSSITYGFKTLKLATIFAHAHKDNLASHNVIIKSGLSWIGDGFYDGMPAKLYKLNNPDLKVKIISSLETHEVRHPVLREGRPKEDCVFNGDDDPDTFHLGLYLLNELVGVVTFIKNHHPDLANPNQYQLRGMAVLSSAQGKNYGSLLIDAGNQILMEKKIGLVWCNAREKALNFYLRNGFEIFGEPFEIPQIGTHFSMFKSLKHLKKKPQ